MKLVAENLTKSFDNKKIIENVSLGVNKGETISLLGISGVGKTTVFNILSGLMSPDSGDVILNDNNITGKSGHISYMLQKDLLFEFRTIIDNVSLPLIIKGEKRKHANKIASKYFHQFGLSGYETKYPRELSGGMRQRAALLRTYLFSNEVCLLDEPFSALDPITKMEMYNWYTNIAKKMGLSTIFITHDIDESILLSNRIYIMTGSPGKITKEIKIINKPKNITEFSLDKRFLDYKRNIINILGE